MENILQDESMKELRTLIIKPYKSLSRSERQLIIAFFESEPIKYDLLIYQISPFSMKNGESASPILWDEVKKDLLQRETNQQVRSAIVKIMKRELLTDEERRTLTNWENNSPGNRIFIGCISDRAYDEINKALYNFLSEWKKTRPSFRWWHLFKVDLLNSAYYFERSVSTFFIRNKIGNNHERIAFLIALAYEERLGVRDKIQLEKWMEMNPHNRNFVIYMLELYKMNFKKAKDLI